MVTRLEELDHPLPVTYGFLVLGTVGTKRKQIVTRFILSAGVAVLIRTAPRIERNGLSVHIRPTPAIRFATGRRNQGCEPLGCTWKIAYLHLISTKRQLERLVDKQLGRSYSGISENLVE